MKYSILIALLIMLSSCSPGPEPIRFGFDECAYCRMIISDHRFGSELVSAKGKIYKYDSVECLFAYTQSKNIRDEDIHSAWTVNFLRPKQLINFNGAFILHSQQLRSPMGLNLVSFASDSDARQAQKEFGGTLITKAEISDLVFEKWLRPKG